MKLSTVNVEIVVRSDQEGPRGGGCGGQDAIQGHGVVHLRSEEIHFVILALSDLNLIAHLQRI